MRLLCFTSAYQLGYGVGLVIKEQLKRLKAESWVATQAEVDEKNVITITPDAQGVREAIGRARPDVIIVHTPPYFQLVAEEAKVPVIAYDHGEPSPGFFEKKEALHRRKIDKAKYEAIRKYDAHICISQFIAQNSHDVHAKVLYSGCDHLNLSSSSKISIHERLGIASDTFLISSLMRIGGGERFYKGYDLLLEVHKLLQEKLKKKFCWVLMGRVVHKGKPIVSRLQKAGIIVMPDVDELTKQLTLTQSDLFVSPSQWEGFNLPLVEAQAMGTAATAFSIGAHPEVCPFHFQSCEEMAEFIISLEANRTLLTDYSKAAKKFVNSRFRWKDNAAQFNTVLKSLTNL